MPVIKLKQRFQAETAWGKLNAEMTPTIPKGFQVSNKTWSGLSEGIIYPLILQDKPHAKSHISIVS